MAFLKPYVGRRVTVRGFWSGIGKAGAYVGPKDHGLAVYLEAVSDQGIEMENRMHAPERTPLEVTGELHLYEYHPLATTDPAAMAVQEEPAHFYFEIERSSVGFGK